MMKYCGYEIGNEISLEQLERLFNFLKANFNPIDFIKLNDEQLNVIAKANKKEWF